MKNVNIQFNFSAHNTFQE